MPRGVRDGAGYGTGYGYGTGDGAYWRAAIMVYTARWTEAQRTRLRVLRRQGATIAYWNSDGAGWPANGGRSSAPARVGLVEHSGGPPTLCRPGTLHATLLPPKWKGGRRWIVALTGEVVGDEEKYGALTREILGEAPPPA